jgi:hypothetical protein
MYLFFILFKSKPMNVVLIPTYQNSSQITPILLTKTQKIVKVN